MQRKIEPLAQRLRAETLDEVVGQEHLLAKGALLRRSIESRQLSSMIFFGPPGCGKTTLAYVISLVCAYTFRQINAVTAGIKDIREVIELSKNPLLCPEGQVLLFIDEIHRFNKSQQDALLPDVEAGNIVLIGATTENPFFEVNQALLSRATVFELQTLKREHIIQLLKRALSDEKKGLGTLNVVIAEPELEKLALLAGGDVRKALNLLELLVNTTDNDASGNINLTAEVFEKLALPRNYHYDKHGEEHYNNISAMIKSMRGSDPDAAVFYLARALEAGESAEFLARRIVIAAAEDVGLANPDALVLAQAAAAAVREIGMPEARIPLAEACIYVAVSPKSNAAYAAVNQAVSDLRNKECGEIPRHILNAPLAGMAENLNYGVGYKYAHDYSGALVAQQFLPDKLSGTHYYEPTANGKEAAIGKWLDEWRRYVADTLSATNKSAGK